MTRDDQAKWLLRGYDLSGEDYRVLVKKIGEALQESFDLGWCAAGGDVQAITTLTSAKGKPDERA